MSAGAQELETFGCVVLRGEIDAVALTAEFDATMRDAFVEVDHRLHGAIGNQFRYVPMMCERTPVSVQLVVRLAAVAAELLQCDVLPGRAKATTYFGSARWHRDSELPVRSIGLAAYLEPLTGATGALCVIPGSHHDDYAAAIASLLDHRADVPHSVLATMPGDLIAFDEHLFHSTSGSGKRRQWRVDFIADDAPDDVLREWYALQYSVGWDAGYDYERYPTYGAYWLDATVAWSARMHALGAHAAAQAEEAAAVRGRPPRP
jgi:hypothetical protein